MKIVYKPNGSGDYVHLPDSTFCSEPTEKKMCYRCLYYGLPVIRKNTGAKVWYLKFGERLECKECSSITFFN